MNRKAVYEKLTQIFRDVFDDENIYINDDTTAEDIEDWDSLEHINLIVAIEKEFGFKFDIEVVTTFMNVGEMVDLICIKVK